MELLIFRPDEFERHYSCVNFDIDDVPLEMRRRFAHPIMHIVLCTIYYILYVPCMWSLWKNRMHSCYKMLFYLGCVDCMALWVPGFLRAYLSLIGAQYCSCPLFQYIAGSFGLSCCLAEVLAQLILSINRCLSLLIPKFEETLFGGYRTWLWMLLPTAYGIAWFFFGKAIVFDGVHFTWALNPYVSYEKWNLEPKYYISNWYSQHVFLSSILLPGVYAIFFIAFSIKIGAYNLSNVGRELISKKQRMVFTQVFMITIFNVASGLLLYLFPRSTSAQAQSYTSGLINSLVEYVVIYSWLNIHGTPPIIFLTLNKTVRNDVIAFMRKLHTTFKRNANIKMTASINILFRSNGVHSINGHHRQFCRPNRIGPTTVDG